MCVVFGLAFKLYCTVNVCSKFTASISNLPVSGKQNNTIGIPENRAWE